MARLVSDDEKTKQKLDDVVRGSHRRVLPLDEEDDKFLRAGYGKEDYILLLQEGEISIEKVPQKYRSDREIMFEAVKAQGVSALKYASKSLRDDVDFIDELLHKLDDVGVLDYASSNLRSPLLSSYIEEKIAEGRLDEVIDYIPEDMYGQYLLDSLDFRGDAKFFKKVVEKIGKIED